MAEKKILGKWPRVLFWTIFIAVLDLGSKALALKFLALHEARPVIPGFFNLTLVFNSGAAFSLFSGEPGAAQGYKMAAIALVSLALMSWFLVKAKDQERWFLTGLGLIYGGAVGNIHDRLRCYDDQRCGAVVDFLDFHLGAWHWPAFNVADIAIVVGVGILILSVLRDKPRAEEPRKS